MVEDSRISKVEFTISKDTKSKNVQTTEKKKIGVILAL